MSSTEAATRLIIKEEQIDPDEYIQNIDIQGDDCNKLEIKVERVDYETTHPPNEYTTLQFNKDYPFIKVENDLDTSDEEGKEKLLESLPRVVAGEFTEKMVVKLSVDSYKCGVCNRMYNARSSCRRHTVLHFKPKLHECDVCGKKFHAPYVLKRHYITHTGEKPYKCEICNRKFAQMGHLQGHVITHEPSKNFECDYCGKKFAAKHFVRRHINTIHFAERPIYTCRLCGKHFLSSRSYKRHRYVHAKEKPYKCHFCSRGFIGRHGIYYHIKQHLEPVEPRKHQCRTCEQTFHDRHELQNHLDTHTTHQRMPTSSNQDGTALKCETCATLFSNQHALTTHLQKFTAHRAVSRIRRHTCNACGKSFARNLAEHGCTNALVVIPNTGKESPVIQTVDGRFHCKLCDRRYCSRRYFKQHLTTHSDALAHKCHLCEKIFANRSQLGRHLRTHTGEQPYTCEFCGRKFSQRSNCRKHCQLAHLGLKKSFDCEICGKTFTEKANLLRHHSIHEGNGKLHACDICGVQFRHKLTLTRHKTTQHDNKNIDESSAIIKVEVLSN